PDDHRRERHTKQHSSHEQLLEKGESCDAIHEFHIPHSKFLIPNSCQAARRTAGAADRFVAQAYGDPGTRRSISGTSVEHAASDHRRPFVRNSRNCTYHAPKATSAANSTRPIRESGVVFGSEIMKKVNSSSAPLSSRCSGIASGSPR